MREIPAKAIEIQNGLWAEAKVVTVGTMTFTKHNLYSSEGYCFYLPGNNLDEDGNLLPENQRLYYQYMASAYRTIEQINENVVSVPVQEGFEIANIGNGNNHEIA